MDSHALHTAHVERSSLLITKFDKSTCKWFPLHIAVAEGGELNVNLQKVKKAETWAGALQGRNANVDPVTLENMQKKIMLERFQSEVRSGVRASADCVS